jgi:hypothetical protein
MAGVEFPLQDVEKFKETIKMVRKAILATLFLALGSVAALAADFSGKWTADVTTPRGTQTLTFDFHVDGKALTGKITTPRGDSDIADGKVDGDNISFSQTMSMNGNDIKTVYTGVATADGIKFSRVSGDRPPVEFVAKRAPAN